MLSKHPWGLNPHVDIILESYVGLRPDLYDGQQIMTLQCYIDDSGSEPLSKYFVLAGYVSKVGAWAKFSEEWSERLKQSGLAYFKMSEAMGWTKEFSKENGWDAKSIENEVNCLSKIIADNCKSTISCRIETSLFQKLVLPTPTVIIRNNTNQNPYYFLYMRLISSYWARCEKMGIKERCDFIFDKQHGYEKRAAELYCSLLDDNKREFPKSHRSYIGSKPRWEDDKEYLPIQAADMVAWLLRRYKNYKNTGKVSQQALKNLLSIEHNPVMHPEEILRMSTESLKGDIRRMKQENPFMKWY